MKPLLWILKSGLTNIGIVLKALQQLVAYFIAVVIFILLVFSPLAVAYIVSVFEPAIPPHWLFFMGMGMGIFWLWILRTGQDLLGEDEDEEEEDTEVLAQQLLDMANKYHKLMEKRNVKSSGKS